VLAALGGLNATYWNSLRPSTECRESADRLDIG
jgi:hypothetical protein